MEFSRLIFHITWIVPLAASLTGIVLSIINFTGEEAAGDQTRSGGILFLSLQIVMFFTFLCTYLVFTNRQLSFEYSLMLSLLSLSGIGGIIMILPSFIRRPYKQKWMKGSSIFFLAAGGVIVVQNLAGASITFTALTGLGEGTLSGMILLPSTLIFILLSVVLILCMLGILAAGYPAHLDRRVERIWKIFAVTTLAAIPVMLTIDWLRGLIPLLSGFRIVDGSSAVQQLYLLIFSVTVIMVNMVNLSRSNQSNILSEREKQVAACLLEGLTYAETAKRLYISLSTVQSHVKNIYRKTGTNSKVKLIIYLNETLQS